MATRPAPSADRMPAAGRAAQAEAPYPRTPLMREITAAADYLRFVRREIATLGSNELAKDLIPQALREIDYIISTSEDFSNGIMSLAEEVIAAPPMQPEDFRAYVADKMTEIIVQCAFQDLTAQRATRVRTVLSTLERRLSRIASMIGTRDVPHLVDFDPHGPLDRLAIGPAAPGEGNDQAGIDALLADMLPDEPPGRPD
jgi:chemotaxis protein CheZ